MFESTHVGPDLGWRISKTPGRKQGSGIRTAQDKKSSETKEVCKYGERAGGGGDGGSEGISLRTFLFHMTDIESKWSVSSRNLGCFLLKIVGQKGKRNIVTQEWKKRKKRKESCQGLCPQSPPGKSMYILFPSLPLTKISILGLLGCPLRQSWHSFPWTVSVDKLGCPLGQSWPSCPWTVFTGKLGCPLGQSWHSCPWTVSTGKFGCPLRQSWHSCPWTVSVDKLGCPLGKSWPSCPWTVSVDKLGCPLGHLTQIGQYLLASLVVH